MNDRTFRNPYLQWYSSQSVQTSSQNFLLEQVVAKKTPAYYQWKQISCHIRFFLRKMLGTRYGSVGTRFL